MGRQIGGVGADQEYPVPAGDDGTRRISPTDVSRFIRLDQCRRYLRLHLHRNACGTGFLRDFGVRAEGIGSLLTLSGSRFEQAVVAAVGRRHPIHHFGQDRRDESGVDNDAAVRLAREVAPGASLVLVQPRLEAVLGGWLVRGDADLIRLERDAAGRLRCLVVDVKSAKAAKVDHRLQVAFYHELLTGLFADHGIECGEIGTGILYRLPSGETGRESPAELARQAIERESAARLFGVEEALLEEVDDPDAYREAVRTLVTGSGSVAERVAGASFAEIPFHLAAKCDGCLYNQFCLKWSAERDDLSLLPHLDEQEKLALRRAGLATVHDVAHLKQPAVDRATGGEDATTLLPAPGREELVRRLGASWPVGPRLDELVHRARAYREYKREPVSSLPYIPSKGYGSLPYSAADHNPNLVRVFLDAQRDQLHDRVYLLGALVVAAEGGVPSRGRRRAVVHLADGPPAEAEIERRLFVAWIEETIRAIVELAVPDEAGAARAPIHLVFADRFQQRALLDGLGRHAGAVLGATPLYDFMTQLAAFDSPVLSFLDEEIREQKNYPMLCQSLQAVAAYTGFDWNAGTPFRRLFHERLFDFWGKFDEPPAPGESPWYTNRARFGSEIPIEYAYAAWGELPPAPPGERDDDAPFRVATPDLLRAFQIRRLEAIEHVAGQFTGNRNTLKTPFDLPSLDRFEDRARSLADALDEFLTIERHVALGAWKRARLAPPERRVAAGETLIGWYREADQLPGVADTMRENRRRRLLKEEQKAAYRLAHPEAKRTRLSKEEKAASEWEASHKGLRVRLRVELDGVDAELSQVAGLTKIKPGDQVVIHPRWHYDTRLPDAERVPLQPTAKQLLRAGRAAFHGLRVEAGTDGRPEMAWIDLVLLGSGPRDDRGFAFPAIFEPLVADTLYTIDPDPNDQSGMTQAKVTAGLREGGENALLDRLVGAVPAVAWPPAAAEGQARFLAGLDALGARGRLHGFEPAKREFIARHGGEATLLVQGPPGTGKSYTTAFALLARLQGAMAAGLDHRIILCCKTHAAVDVLLDNLVSVRSTLARLVAAEPELAGCFDRRLFGIPLYRLRPRGEVHPPVVPLVPSDELPKGAPAMAQRLRGDRWGVAAGTPGAVYKLVKEHGGKEIFGHRLVDALVLDEASQMNLPEAAMAALPLKPNGHLIVVGDHRQMPPIVHHDWENEARRSFREYRSYESLFATLLARGVPTIRFAESFRLHRALAEFLRREVYQRDGIPYFSRRDDLLELPASGDRFVDAVLDPSYPLVVVVHDEAASQAHNPFEQALLAPVLAGLAAAGFDAQEGLGVVVPHRAQRAALQEAVPALVVRDPDSGEILLSAVDTVERFQGGERTAIVVSATESDPGYLLRSAGFLLDPRRLTVALSRAKQKMILVAARSVFDLFSPDEETFQNAQLWKNLLRRTCTAPLWRGEREGVGVEVWGNRDETAGTQA